MVAAETPNTVSTLSRLLLTIITSAVEMAMSAPQPSATPMSAHASAGESLMPSPTKHTCLPRACSALTASDLSAGLTSQSTLSMPSIPAIRSAFSRLSPLIIHSSMPRSLSARIASAAPGRSCSAPPVSPSVSVPVLSKTTVSVL